MNIQKLSELLQQHPIIEPIVTSITEHGGSAYLVGGAVRDLLLNVPVKDIDIEVHNVSLEQLSDLLQQYGNVNYVGKSFGVLKLEYSPIDWSIPRTDKSGRKPEVTLNPNMSIQEALARRDLTMNAMAINLVTHELIDPFGGYHDMLNKILRAPNIDFFIEDPLRFYRVMQFISRFEMEPDAALTKVCKTMDISTVSRERVEMEFEKLLLKSAAPSRGIRWLHNIGRLQEILPELAATVGVEQNPEWHPEGDVFEHTMQALDEAALLDVPDTVQKLILLYAALCHDLGKAVTTHIIDGKITSYKHEIQGVPLARKLLKRITNNTIIISTVSLLVRYHMCPGIFVKSNAKPKAYKRLALKLAPLTNLHMLGLLAYADRRGRKPLTQTTEIDEFMRQAECAQVLMNLEKPILNGRDLLDVIQPGPLLGKLVKHAYDIQINNNIHDKAELKKRVLNSIKK